MINFFILIKTPTKIDHVYTRGDIILLTDIKSTPKTFFFYLLTNQKKISKILYKITASYTARYIYRVSMKGNHTPQNLSAID